MCSLVLMQFLQARACRSVQLFVPFCSTWTTRVGSLNRSGNSYEFSVELLPDRTNHDCGLACSRAQGNTVGMNARLSVPKGCQLLKRGISLIENRPIRA